MYIYRPGEQGVSPVKLQHVGRDVSKVVRKSFIMSGYVACSDHRAYKVHLKSSEHSLRCRGLLLACAVLKLLNHASSKLWGLLVIYGPSLFPTLGLVSYFAKPAHISYLLRRIGYNYCSCSCIELICSEEPVYMCPAYISPIFVCLL